jgi:hypothetical protein
VCGENANRFQVTTPSRPGCHGASHHLYFSTMGAVKEENPHRAGRNEETSFYLVGSSS